MDTISVEDAKPKVRCKTCGSDEFVAVCHHCAIPLCTEHLLNGADGSSEFKGFDLRKKGRSEEPVHCTECRHRVFSRTDLAVLILGGLLGLLAFNALPLPLPLAVVAWLVCSIAIVASIATFLRQRGDERYGRCPIIPEVENQRIVETYRFRSFLSPQGAWVHEVLPSAGVARADLRFGPDDVKRVAKYSRRGRGAEGGELDAGFVAMELENPYAIDGVNAAGESQIMGAERVVLNARDVPYLYSDNQTGDRDSHAPSERGLAEAVDASPNEMAGRRPSSVVSWSSPYSLRLPDGEVRLPVQVVPTLAPGSDRRTLELHVDWRSTARAGDLETQRLVYSLGDLRPSRINFLEFRLPLVGLGSVTPVEGDPIVTDAPDQGTRTIRWESVAVNPGESEKKLSVRFEQPVPADLVIAGELALEFAGSVGGVAHIEWFDPMGHPLTLVTDGDTVQFRPVPLTSASIVDLSFEIALASLPYEASFVQLEKPIVVPPELLAEVRPDHITAIEICHILTEAGFYIFDISESTFAPSDRSAEQNRVWELKGRYFANVAPLDFQVKVTGSDLRRRLEGSTETYQLSGVTLAGQASYDTSEALADFEAQLLTVEERTRAALVRLAGRGHLMEIEAGEAHFEATGADIYASAEVGLDDVAVRPSESTVDSDPLMREYDVANYVQIKKCSMCGKPDVGSDYTVCHHCGRLLCITTCTAEILQDKAFTNGQDGMGTRAAHCEDCAKEHHSLLGNLRQMSIG